MTTKIPISAAKRVADDYKCHQVIIVAWDGQKTHVVTYGDTIEACDQAAQGGNFVKKALGWPENLCQSEPSRVLELKARIAELEEQIQDATNERRFD